VLHLSNCPKPVVIGIIDSGIDGNVCNLKTFVKHQTEFIIDKEGKIVESSDIDIKNEHGTIIASVIKEICPDIEIISYKIFNENLESNSFILLHSLKQIINLKPDIIHLSLGTTNMRYVLKYMHIIHTAKMNKIIIVAAADNFGKRSFPAYLKGVLGVKAASLNNHQEYFYCNNFFYAHYEAKVIMERNGYKGSDNGGTSISAAYITGYLAKLVYDTQIHDYKILRKSLISNSNLNYNKGDVLVCTKKR
jgi:hypothetical protein